MSQTSKILLLLLFTMFIVSDACPGLFGGGGGGCCGGCHGGGGGCGRKKRSTNDLEFAGIVSQDGDMLCNSPEMKKLIVESMAPTPTESTKTIQAALEEHDLHRYVVVCSENPFHYSVKVDTAYCGARNGKHYCQAFAL